MSIRKSLAYSRTSWLPVFAVLIFSTQFFACSSSKKGGNAYLERIGITTLDFDREMESLSPELVVNRTTRTNVYLGILATGSDAQPTRLSAMSQIESVSFVVIDKDGNPIDSLYTDDVQMSGLGGSEGSSILAAGTNWAFNDGMPNNFTLVVIVRAGKRIWVRQASTTLPVMAGLDPIELSLDVVPKDDGHLEMTLTAKRIDRPPVTEHLASGELYRITIFDGPFKIWSTADKAAFTSVITDVVPGDVGDAEEWVIDWDGIKSDGKQANSGNLTIEARIPALPSPYVLRKDFRYGGR